MCGIYGQLCFNAEINLKNCLKALNLLSHRGPDGYGFLYGNYNTGTFKLFHNENPSIENKYQYNYFLGHRRLSIIDLNANAFQPMCTKDNNYIIIFNGEIYNYCELKKELLTDGFTFYTDHSDTEVLLNLYIRWKEKCLEKLRGMFVFAIYDRQLNKIFIARDRVGQKTLYYQYSNEKFVFASELTSIIKYENTRYRIDNDALALYLSYGYIPFPKSIFEGINKLAPASFAWLDPINKTLKIKEYWDVDISSENSKNFSDWKKVVDKNLKESVSLRLRSDVPLGVFSSGGIDSTIILQKVKESGYNSIDTFSADFPQKKHSELEYIEIVNKMFNTNLNITMIGESVAEEMKHILSVFDEPFDGGSSIALFKMFEKIQNHKKVMLTGDGGDEIFGGYERYSKFLRRKLFKNLIEITFIWRALSKIIKVFGIKNQKLERIINLLSKNELDYYMDLDSRMSLTELLMVPSKNIDFFKDFYHKFEKKEGIKNIQYLEFKTILPGRMLYKLDRFSMNFGIEARSPFLDHLLIETAFKIPSKMNVGIMKMKEILKSILLKDFEKSFVRRKKKGFGNPIDHWFRNIDSQTIFKCLLNKDSLIYKYLDYDKTHKKFHEIKDGYQGEHKKELWRLLVLCDYLESYKHFIRL